MKKTLCFMVGLCLLLACEEREDTLITKQTHQLLSIDTSKEIQDLHTDLINSNSISRSGDFQDILGLANWERVQKEMRRDDQQTVYAMPLYIESDYPLNNLLVYYEQGELKLFIVSLDLDLGTISIENVETGLVETGTRISAQSSNGRAMWMDCYSITIGHTAYVEVGGMRFPKYAQLDYEVCGSGEVEYPRSDGFKRSGGGDPDDNDNSGNPVVDDSDLPCPIGFERVGKNCLRACDLGLVRNDAGECVTEEDLWEEDKICTSVEFDLNSCLNTVWQFLKDTDTAHELLKKFNSENPSASVCMDISYSMPDDRNGETLGLRNPIQINFNGNNLDRSQLQVARTIFHELIHAEMWRKINSVNRQLHPDNFPGLFDYYSRYFRVRKPDGTWHYPNGSPQHNLMAAHYLEFIADALMDFDCADKSDVQLRESYEALAWKGLEETVVWDSLDSIDKQAIVTLRNLLVNSREKCNE